MPSVILDRIPLPNVRIYTALSVLMVSACLHYAIVSTNDPDWRSQNNSTILTSFTEQELIGPDSLLKAAVDGISNNIESKVIQSIQEAPVPNTVDDPIVPLINANNDNSEPTLKGSRNVTRTFTEQFKDVMAFMSQEAVCIWVSDFNLILLLF